MNNPYVQRVYQKLAHARALLGLVQVCGQAIPERQRSEALIQGALLHVGIAYRLYLRELAHRYGLPKPDVIIELEGLRQSLLQGGNVAPEVIEMERLEGVEAWAASMLAAEQGALNPSVAEVSVQRAGLIAVSSVVPSVLTAELVSHWCQCLSELSERQRSSGAEF